MVARPTSLSTTTSTSSLDRTRSIERPAYSPTEPFFSKSSSSSCRLVKTRTAHERSLQVGLFPRRVQRGGCDCQGLEAVRRHRRLGVLQFHSSRAEGSDRQGQR